jgi:hypothetical protein
MSATVHQLRPALSQQDFEAMTSIQQKRAEGKPLTEMDKQALGRFANQMVDSLDVEANGALKNALKKFLTNGQLSQAEQLELRAAIGEIPTIKENMPLTTHLKSMVAKGFATDADLDKIPQLAGKLSVFEDDAIYAALSALAVTDGIPKGPAATKLKGYLERARIDREKFCNKQGFYGQAKRLGLMALTVIGLVTLFTVAPFAALGTVGAVASQVGLVLGSAYGVNKASSALANSNNQKIMSYGVND